MNSVQILQDLERFRWWDKLGYHLSNSSSKDETLARGK